MKTKLFLICLMTVCCLPIQAQASDEDHFPFAQEGKTWEMQVGGIKENDYCNRIDGDTLIGGETWKKVYNYIAFRDLNYSYYAAIRDVGMKVYAIAKGSNKPRLLYDFGMKVGDKVKCGVEGNTFCCLLEKGEKPDTLLGFKYVASLRLERIDTIETHGLQLRRFTLTLLDPYERPMARNIIWIEGVGSFLSPFLPWTPAHQSDELQLLKRCSIDKIYISSNDDFYKNDETNDIQSNSYIGNESGIYNQQGVKMVGKPQKGIYIQNGRKYVR
jgi:hypothetical protein